MASDLDRLLAKALQQGPQNTITPQPQTVMDTAAMATSPIPGLGDILGLIADLGATKNDPSLANLLMMGAGVIPFVPGGSGRRVSKKIKDAVLESNKNPTFDEEQFRLFMDDIDQNPRSYAEFGERVTKPASRTKKWRIWDTKEKKWASGPYTQKNRARKRVDRLDNEYGAYRYMVKEYKD